MTFTKATKDLFFVLLIALFVPVFYYKLGQSSLISFDEAWYADIARNILDTGELFKTYWNGKVFADHPPAGFWLMAMSYKLFGISEFSARLVSATSGLLGLIFIYLLGKELFGRVVGFSSAMSLAASNWYLFRARSGNLDSLLTMLFIVTIYFALMLTKDKKYLWPTAVSFTLLLLTKSMAPFTILPTLIFILWKKTKVRDLVLPLLFVGGVVGYWFFVQMNAREDFLSHFIGIGLPGIKENVNLLDNFLLMKTYLHNGIGRIFWLGIVGLIGGALTFQKRFWILGIFFASFFAPFLLSSRGHIWHLIPLHAFMILAFFGVFFLLLNRITRNKILIGLVLIFSSIIISYPQLARNWYEFVDTDPFVSDEAILSRTAGQMAGKFFVDGDFTPAAVFYSGKNVRQIHARVGNLKEIMEKNPGMLLITKKWRLDAEEIDPANYKIVQKDRDRLLVQEKRTPPAYKLK